MESPKRIPTPHYHVPDTFAIIRSIPYLRIATSSLLGFLKHMAASGRAYAQLLPLHPLVSCDPLDLHYVCAKAICALDEDLMSDLLLVHSWRESNIGAFLALLSPDPKYRELLVRRRPTLSRGLNTIDLAIAAIDDYCNQALLEQFKYARIVQAQIATIRVEPVPLRVSLSGEYIEPHRAEVNRIREAYHSGGSSAATALMRTGIVGYYNQPYREWVANGALPLPPVDR